MVEVLSAGLFTTIQDLGRYKGLAWGVPLSGAMDQTSAGLANALLNNRKACAVLEMTLVGPKLRFHCDTEICLTGAALQGKINETKAVLLNQPTMVQSGDVLSFGKSLWGTRAYLAVKGGFQTEQVMQSYSMYAGITSEGNIEKGMLLPIQAFSEKNPPKKNSLKLNKAHFENSVLNVFPGPEFAYLSEGQKEKLLGRRFTISKNNNRMAYTLEELLENELTPIITSLVQPGTVQLTPAGNIIVLMRDAQTTGGYPRILQLSEQAMNQLSQKRTKDWIGFDMVDY